MARVKASPGNRAEGRRSTPLLATALALGLLTALAVGPAWASAAAPDADPVATAAEPVNEPGGEEPPTTPAEEPTPTEDPGGEPEPTDPAPETTAPPPETTPPAPVTTAPEVPPAPTTVAPAPGGTTRPPSPAPPIATDCAPGPADTPGSVGPAARAGFGATAAEPAGRAGHHRRRHPHRGVLEHAEHGRHPPGHRAQHRYHCAAGPTLVHAARRADRRRHEGLRGRRWRRVPLRGLEHRSGRPVQHRAAPAGRLARRGSRCRSAARSRSSRTRRECPGKRTTTRASRCSSRPARRCPGSRSPPTRWPSTSAEAPAPSRSGWATPAAVDAAGRVEVVLPAGVTVPTPPLGCVAVDPTRTRCDAGLVLAGTTAEVRLPVEATPQAQREAPLSGAVIGQLDPRSGPTRRVQMSFRITAAAALATPVVSPPAPTGSQGVLPAGARDRRRRVDLGAAHRGRS